MPTPPKQIVLAKDEIGARLRAIRQRKGLTQDQLARAIGSHFTAISAVECGRRALTLQQAATLAAALQVSPDELISPIRATRARTMSRRDALLLRRVERIQELPPSGQRTVLDVLESLLKAHANDQG